MENTIGKKVDDYIIEKVLSVYKSPYRYLREANIEFSIIKGRFEIDAHEYIENNHVEKVKHLTDVEAQICLNQLCYVFFGQGIIDNNWEWLNISNLEDFLNLRHENMFINESHKKFKRETDVSTSFFGTIELIKHKKIRNLSVGKLKFDLNDGAAEGTLTVVCKI